MLSQCGIGERGPTFRIVFFLCNSGATCASSLVHLTALVPYLFDKSWFA